MEGYIITCDDYGLSEGINLAAIELYERGIATQVSVMTNCDATQHGLELLLENPGLKCGIHLNLNDGHSLTGHPLFFDKRGHILSRAALFAGSLFPTKKFLEQVAQELEAQIGVFLAAGLRLSHLDTHLNFHSFPRMREIVYDLGLKYSVDRMRSPDLRSVILPPFEYEQRTKCADPFDFTDYIVPIKYWLGHPPEQLARRLEKVKGTVEIVVHPCLPEDSTFPPEAWYSPAERNKEVLYLERLVDLL